MSGKTPEELMAERHSLSVLQGALTALEGGGSVVEDPPSPLSEEEAGARLLAVMRATADNGLPSIEVHYGEGHRHFFCFPGYDEDDDDDDDD